MERLWIVFHLSCASPSFLSKRNPTFRDQHCSFTGHFVVNPACLPCICCLIQNGSPTAFLLFKPPCTGWRCPCRDPQGCPPMPRQDGIGDNAPTLIYLDSTYDSLCHLRDVLMFSASPSTSMRTLSSSICFWTWCS